MSCGADDTLCQILALIFADNEYATGVVTKWLGQTGILGGLSAFARDHGEKLIALAGFSFGVWRWWKYRETVLHKRLTEYLTENDRRLIAGQTYLLNAIRRPQPGRKPASPLFASGQLRRVLQRHNWDGTVSSVSVEDGIDRQLEEAKSWIDRHLETANETVLALRNQLATVHILRGALASVDATSIEALTLFRNALAVPGHEGNLVAKELEAHSLRKLKRHAETLEAYKAVEVLALSRGADEKNALVAANAKRYQAELIQAQAVTFDALGKAQFQRTTAFNLVSPNVPSSALSIRAKFAPYHAWDQLDQADTHYLAAFLANVAGFGPAEQTQLAQARIAYEDVAHGRIWKLRRLPASLRLRKLARQGLARVKLADEGQYDSKWLLP